MQTNQELFTTADGVKIFKGDAFYFISENGIILPKIAEEKKNYAPITFSSVKAAEEYIIKNKKS